MSEEEAAPEAAELPPGREPAADSASSRPPAAEVLVVGIGASAGGLDPMGEILRRLPKTASLAVIVVQHLGPDYKSELAELLARSSALPVQWAANGTVLAPGHVYVIPPKTAATLRHNVLLLRSSEHGAGREITHLFRSLAADAKERAVAVVLSGSNADGAAGAVAVHRNGGLVYAQDPATAAYAVMPQSAIETRCVDRVLSPTGIARELARLAEDSSSISERVATATAEGRANVAGSEPLAAIFRLLMARTGVDFTEYKRSTIERRLVRRMAVVKANDLVEYLRVLQRNRDEVDLLYDSLLINVTEFFRDTEYFDFLSSEILPGILKAHEDGTPVRVWVAACSTGEEVYSIGILLRELMEATGRNVPVQIFGTDISEAMITQARMALFTAAEVASVSPERLRRFFTKSDRGYAVHKGVRDLCVFARQNVLKDSPFSRLDLISCRNLMIYLSPKLQRQLIPVFHYSLVPGGTLLLGNSESVGGYIDLFRLIDRRFRIYARKSTSRRTHFEIHHEPIPVAREAAKPLPPVTPDDMKEPSDVIREADRIVMSRYSPCGALVNDDFDILQFRGDVTPFLAPVPGRASLNILKMAREGLLADLEQALLQARSKNSRVERTGVAMSQGDTIRAVNIDVTPVESVRTREKFYLVLFELAASRPVLATVQAETDPAIVPQIDQLRQELQATRSYLQTTVERHEATNQELRAANEEIQSSNEELQSTNEELETAKEELQSTNEELTTVNEELHSRQMEMIQLNNDLQNLINSVHLPIIILGQDLRIRRFTPMAQKVLNVIPSDVGRLLSDLNIKLKIPNLPDLIREVVESLTIVEQEVQDSEGLWHSLRLRPYKTAANKIDGVVLTLVDIDAMKRALAEAETARSLVQLVFEATREPIAVLSADLKLQNANDAFYRLFGTTKLQAEGRSIFDAVKSPAREGELRRILDGILPTRGSLTDQTMSIDLPGVGEKLLEVSVRQLASAGRAYPIILLSFRRA